MDKNWLFSPLLTVCLTAGIAALALTRCTMAAEDAVKRPNVLIVLTDDQGYGDLSCHANPYLNCTLGDF